MSSSSVTDEKTTVTFSLVQEEEVPETAFTNEVVFEPVQQESYDLSYTCLLLPRFPAHQLKGDLALFLPQWLQQICLSFGWRLEFISVDNAYLQWAISVQPETPPVRFMQQIRYDTSRMIFENFGRIRQENLSNDFWAPGYLVVLGTRPHSKEMIEQYIRLTRRQQGLNTL
ncbi:MAG: transposase [Anaerolineales bacterium]|nr:transposase [Anaerolineales bacterium]